MKTENAVALSELKAQLANCDEQIAELTAKREKLSLEIAEITSKKSTAVERVLAVMAQYNIDVDDLTMIAPAPVKVEPKPQASAPDAAKKSVAPKAAKKSAKKATKTAVKKSPAKKTSTKSVNVTEQDGTKAPVIMTSGANTPFNVAVANHPAGIESPEIVKTNKPVPSVTNKDEGVVRSVVYEELPEAAPSADDD